MKKHQNVLATLKIYKKFALLKKKIPYGDNVNSKKSIYSISDFFFRFWYKFVFSNISTLSLLGASSYVEMIFNDIPSVLGFAFEEVCLQYLSILAQKNKLPFIPNGLGKWWKNNPKKRMQDDIDIMEINKNKGIFCKCKFKNELFDLKEFNDLISASEIFSEVNERYYYIFVKSGFTNSFINESKKYK